MKLVLIALLLFSRHAPALEVEKALLRQLRSARTSKEINEVRQQHEQLLRDKRVCDLQIAQGFIPSACYRWLNTRRAWNLTSLEQAGPLLEKFDEQCRLAAQREWMSAENRLEVNLSDLSPECRRLVQHAQKIYRYRVGARIEMVDPP